MLFTMDDLNDIINDFLNSDLDILLGHQYAKNIITKYCSKIKTKKSSGKLIAYMKRDIYCNFTINAPPSANGTRR